MRKRFALLFCVAVLAVPAQAKDIILTLNDDEQRGLIQMIDAAVKSAGLQGAEAAVYMHRKIMAAQADANRPSAPAPAHAPKSE